MKQRWIARGVLVAILLGLYSLLIWQGYTFGETLYRRPILFAVMTGIGFPAFIGLLLWALAHAFTEDPQ